MDRRLPLYSYLKPLLEGARVLEITTGDGASAQLLAQLGASKVVSVGGAGRSSGKIQHLAAFSVGELERHAPFDVIILASGERFFSPATAQLTWPQLGRLLAPTGHLCASVASADTKNPERTAIEYYAALDALTPHFPVVRMFGQTAFAALGIAEFDAAEGGLRVEAGLVDPESEEPSHYLLVAGQDEGPAFGYALVQVEPGSPAAVAPQVAIPSAATGDVAKALAAKDAEIRALTQKLVEFEGKSEGVTRVSRAQAEEIEELRARLRRAAEMRGELDEEVARLRRSLTEADESVMNLTRRTADEMSALAERITSGLRPDLGGAIKGQGDGQALAEQLKARDVVLARRESELFERDERIAGLEIEKQDLMWRLEAAADVIERKPTVVSKSAPSMVSASASTQHELEELRHTLQVRDRVLHEFRAAAQAHSSDADRLRIEVSEQRAHIIEMDDLLRTEGARADAATQEAAQLRGRLSESEQADRTRRSRLAEIEGQLLRMRHQGAAQNKPQIVIDTTALQLAQRRGDELQAQLLTAQQVIRSLEAQISALTDRCAERDAGMAELAHLLSQRTGADGVSDISQQARAQDAAREVLENDTHRLRDALAQSENELRRSRAAVLPLRDQLSDLQSERDVRIEAELSFFRTLSNEVATLEEGLRNELANIQRANDVLNETPPPPANDDGSTGPQGGNSW
jgi:chromosome segregation ATPase